MKGATKGDVCDETPSASVICGFQQFDDDAFPALLIALRQQPRRSDSVSSARPLGSLIGGRPAKSASQFIKTRCNCPSSPAWSVQSNPPSCAMVWGLRMDGLALPASNCLGVIAAE